MTAPPAGVLPADPAVRLGGSADDIGLTRRLLAEVGAGRLGPQLRLYRPPPTVAFGRRETHHAGYPAAVAAAGRRGFEPVVRNAGGRAVAYGDGCLVVELIAPDPSPPARLNARFAAFGESLAAALRGLGVDATVGRLDGEFCPGDYSVIGHVAGGAAGSIKLAGTAQRLVARAWLCSASIAVSGAAPLRDVLVDVYRELEFDWRPETLGAIADLVPSVTMLDVEAAVIRTFGGTADVTAGRAADAANGGQRGRRGAVVSGLDREIADWPVGSAAVAVIGPDGPRDRVGSDRPYAWASMTKLLTALVVLRAAAEGVVDLDEPAGPPGSTVRHLLAHASGLTLRGRPAPMTAPGQRRVYSNVGYELLAELLEGRTGRPFHTSLSSLVLGPLGLRGTALNGSPAGGAVGPIDDLAALASELLAPRALPPDVVSQLGTLAFPGLPGELPGFGQQEHNDWGLGAEIRDHKSPHWTSPDNSPRTFGHFGRSGGFLWVDPEAGLACGSLSDRDFGPWSADRWPRLSTHVLAGR